MTSPSDASAARSQVWTRKHLLGLEDLTAEEITLILDQAAEFKAQFLQGDTKLDLLTGSVVANLFFEPSTRTRTRMRSSGLMAPWYSTRSRES